MRKELIAAGENEIAVTEFITYKQEELVKEARQGIKKTYAEQFADYTDLWEKKLAIARAGAITFTELAQWSADYWKKVAQENLGVVINLSTEMSKIIGKAVGDSAKGAKDVWVNAYNAMVDVAINALQQIVAGNLTVAWGKAIALSSNPLTLALAPGAWAEVAGWTAAAGGLELVRSGIKASPGGGAAPSTPTYTTPGPGEPGTASSGGSYATGGATGGGFSKIEINIYSPDLTNKAELQRVALQLMDAIDEEKKKRGWS